MEESQIEIKTYDDALSLISNSEIKNAFLFLKNNFNLRKSNFPKFFNLKKDVEDFLKEEVFLFFKEEIDNIKSDLSDYRKSGVDTNDVDIKMVSFSFNIRSIKKDFLVKNIEKLANKLKKIKEDIVVFKEEYERIEKEKEEREKARDLNEKEELEKNKSL